MFKSCGIRRAAIIVSGAFEDLLLLLKTGVPAELFQLPEILDRIVLDPVGEIREVYHGGGELVDDEATKVRGQASRYSDMKSGAAAGKRET